MTHFLKTAAAAACILASQATFAEQTRHMDAHVHGSGLLNFAVEGQQLHLELETPGFDILGFESLTTEKQHQQLNDALAQLKKQELWTLSPAASCSLASAEASSSKEAADKHSGHDEHEEHGHHDEHDHHAEHKHDEHDHHDDHGHDHASEDSHLDITASYVFECKDINKLDSITANLFKLFPNSQTLKVQGFTDKGQSAATLTREKPEVRF
ncbi:ZrgA family zinc uptake protein [Parendozoicomonas haliclonae]|uniref:DUF2796 domain-containing protein n=1 Tax=Parendozoicomonas haliclonae TaxID=1960125 RepID=A0A1X7AIH6_9GAMM|nr:DUF2796 domain-containing protein [Parendozoicomonas haliclonae]SMA43708.1 hypothetical protein EHSB41UT_01650 [Parendozoicomonas haliclonae]